MFRRSLEALKLAVNAANIAMQARSLHLRTAPSATSPIKVIHGAIPKSLIERSQEEHHQKSLQTQLFPVLISPAELQIQSAEVWKFLKKEAKANQEAAEIVKMIEQFRDKKVDIAILEDKMPKVERHKSRLDIRPMVDHNTFLVGSDMNLTELMRIVKILQSNELTLNLTQIFYSLSGFTPFNRLLSRTDTIPLTINYNTTKQQRHKDGYIDEMGENPLAVNTLFTDHVDEHPTVSTVFVHDDTVLAALRAASPEAIAILEKPIFTTPPSTKPRAILTKNAQGYKISYSSPILDEKHTTLSEGGKEINYHEQAKDALKKFKTAVAQAEKSDVFSIILRNQLLFFRNEKLIHARDSHVLPSHQPIEPIRGNLFAPAASTENPQRVAVSLSGKSDNRARE